MPAKIDELIAFNCTSAGVVRGSDGGIRGRLAKVKRDAIAGCGLISVRSWSRTARHSTRTAVIDGVLNSLAESPAMPAKSKQKAASQRLSKLTAILFNAIAPRRTPYSSARC
jgi:hypothetical protein